jgi:hypothetical protein
MCFQGVGWQGMEVQESCEMLASLKQARRYRKARKLGAGNGEKSNIATEVGTEPRAVE